MQATMKSRANLERVARESDLLLTASSRREQEQVIDELGERVVIENDASASRDARRAGGGWFSVRFADSNPKTAYRVVRTLLNTFMEDSLGLKRSDSDVAQRFLQQQVADYERKLRESESRLAEFKKANVGLMPGAEGDYYQRLETAMTALETMRGRYSTGVGAAYRAAAADRRRGADVRAFRSGRRPTDRRADRGLPGPHRSAAGAVHREAPRSRGAARHDRASAGGEEQGCARLDDGGARRRWCDDQRADPDAQSRHEPGLPEPQDLAEPGGRRAG